MKNIFSRAISFIKENPSIIFSLILVVIIPIAFFINTYIINSSYEKVIDQITLRKAALAEKIINNLIKEKFTDKEFLQSTIEKIIQENEEIVELSIIRPSGNQNEFEVIASSNIDLIGQKDNDSVQSMIAWNRAEVIAFLDKNDQGRFWKVTKIISNELEEKIGLVSMSFSLKITDNLTNRTINKSYWILILTVLVVVIFVSNQARLFGYALAVTKLKEIDKMKDMFISIASHELRTPLTAIKGYVELLGDKKEISENEENQHFIERISVSVDRLQNLVNDILEVSRAEGNSLPIEITDFDPNQTIIQSIDELRSQATQKNLTLNYKLFEKPVIISADVNRLKQVLVNLIGNSIKYTEKGSVDVSSEMKNGKFMIIVADTGIGISSEDQANLFQKFYRVQTDKTKNIIGTGLGLWITLEIVRRMKGKITVESIEGVGSHFMVQLPLAKK